MTDKKQAEFIRDWTCMYSHSLDKYLPPQPSYSSPIFNISVMFTSSGPILALSRLVSSITKCGMNCLVFCPVFWFGYTTHACVVLFSIFVCGISNSIFFKRKYIVAFIAIVGIEPMTLCLHCRHANHLTKSPDHQPRS